MLNKKYFLLTISVFSFFGAVAQNSLLWKVTHKDSKHTSYLFGSMHTNDSVANSFGPEWYKAMHSCDVFAGEVDMSNTANMMGALQVAMMKDKTLADLYSASELAMVNDAIKKALDPMTAQLCQKMKPFFVLASILEAPKKDSPHRQIMDLRLQGLASKNGKKIVGLETVQEQASSIDVLTLEEQAQLLLDYVKEGNTTDTEKEKMNKFYLDQNLDSLYALASSDKRYPEKMMKSLLDDRNDRFIKNLLPQLQSASVFCAVGAMHLTGSNGMIAQLRKNGYEVVAVPFRFGE